MRRAPHLPSNGRLVEDFVDSIKSWHVALLILVVLAITIFAGAP